MVRLDYVAPKPLVVTILAIVTSSKTPACTSSTKEQGFDHCSSESESKRHTAKNSTNMFGRRCYKPVPFKNGISFSHWLYVFMLNFAGCTEFAKNQHLLGFGRLLHHTKFHPGHWEKLHLSALAGAKMPVANKNLVRNPLLNIILLVTCNLEVTRKILDCQLPHGFQPNIWAILQCKHHLQLEIGWETTSESEVSLFKSTWMP